MLLSFIIMWSPDSRNFYVALKKFFPSSLHLLKPLTLEMPLIRGLKLHVVHVMKNSISVPANVFHVLQPKVFFHIKIHERCSFCYYFHVANVSNGIALQVCIQQRHFSSKLSFMENKMNFLVT